MTRRLPLLLSALVVVSCSASTNSSPTSPTATQPAVTRIIAIEGSLAFGDVRVGQSKDLTVTIRNTGTGTLTVAGFSAPTALFNHLSAPAGSRTVAPGGTGTMTFRLTPLAVGPLAGPITINADHTSGNNTIPFSGTGIPAANE